MRTNKLYKPPQTWAKIANSTPNKNHSNLTFAVKFAGRNCRANSKLNCETAILRQLWCLRSKSRGQVVWRLLAERSYQLHSAVENAIESADSNLRVSAGDWRSEASGQSKSIGSIRLAKGPAGTQRGKSYKAERRVPLWRRICASPFSPFFLLFSFFLWRVETPPLAANKTGFVPVTGKIARFLNKNTNSTRVLIRQFLFFRHECSVFGRRW